LTAYGRADRAKPFQQATQDELPDGWNRDISAFPADEENTTWGDPEWFGTRKMIVRLPQRRDDMTTKKHTFKTIPAGIKVSWHYRSAIGHGSVTGVREMGTNADNTMYSVRETDHHPGEPAIVHHSGKALSRV
jgi:hypothetical protein